MEIANGSSIKLEKLIDMATPKLQLFIDSLRFEPIWFQRLIYVIGQITCDFTEPLTVMDFDRDHWSQFWADEDVKLMNPYNYENVKEMKRVLNVYTPLHILNAEPEGSASLTVLWQRLLCH